MIAAASHASVIYLRRSTTVWAIDSGYCFVGIAVAAFVSGPGGVIDRDAGESEPGLLALRQAGSVSDAGGDDQGVK